MVYRSPWEGFTSWGGAGSAYVTRGWHEPSGTRTQGCGTASWPRSARGSAGNIARMKRILITGMSGTGKSALIDALGERGLRAVDLDEPGWSISADDGDWIWHEERVAELLDTPEEGEWLFVSGCATNQGKFRDRFDEVVLLSAPTELILERLATRTSNDYGKRPEEVAEVLGYIETVEPLLRRAASHEVDTSLPLTEVLARVLRLVGADRALGDAGSAVIDHR